VTRRSTQTRRVVFGRSIFLAATLISGSLAPAATTTEIWPELDLWFHLTEPLRLLLTDSGVRDSESGDKTQAAGGVYIDYRLSKNISFRAGYRYLQGLELSTGARGNVEHRQVYDFNYYWHLGKDAQIVDRTRIDVRDQNGKMTYRYRNRLLFNHELEVRGVRLIPYASAELFYDTQYDRLNRLQFRLGATLPTGPNLAWDFYLARQRDTYPTTKFANALGITLNVKY
jgi:hypothetical protein